jgi:hypothetical protein
MTKPSDESEDPPTADLLTRLVAPLVIVLTTIAIAWYVLSGPPDPAG